MESNLLSKVKQRDALNTSKYIKIVSRMIDSLIKKNEYTFKGNNSDKKMFTFPLNGREGVKNLIMLVADTSCKANTSFEKIQELEENNLISANFVCLKNSDKFTWCIHSL